MAIYIAFLVLNLLGMGYLFYIKDRQKEVDREFLNNAIIVNAVLEILRKDIEDLGIKIGELEKEIEELKNK